MNICLISTENDLWTPGMRSISSFLKMAGHNTRMILMNSNKDLYSSKIMEETKRLVYHSDLIGISSLSQGSEKAKQVIQFLRPLNKLIVWGGIHPTLMPEDCVTFADIVCRGEGEIFMLDLIERLEKNKTWNNINNGAYIKNNHLVLNEIRPLIANLDELPIPDFDFDDEYHLNNEGFKKVSTINDSNESIMFSGSRGCAFNCTYCSNAKLKKLFSGKGRYVRRLSVSKYIEYTAILKKKFPERSYFYFLDEDFFARDVVGIEQFSKEFPRTVGLPFECMVSPMQLTEKKMDLLVKAGLFRIRMGIESGSDRTKKEIYNRKMPNKKVLHAAEIVNKHTQVIAYYFLIIGNPYENRSDLLQTIKFMSDLPTPYWLHIFNLVFSPGTLLYEYALNDGIITGKQDSGYNLNFRGGLEYKNLSWKYRNLYLNSLLFTMEGKSDHFRIGMLPRPIFRFFLSPVMLYLGDKYIFISKFLIRIKMLTLRLRNVLSIIMGKVIKNPQALFKLKFVLKTKMKNI